MREATITQSNLQRRIQLGRPGARTRRNKHRRGRAFLYHRPTSPSDFRERGHHPAARRLQAAGQHYRDIVGNCESCLRCPAWIQTLVHRPGIHTSVSRLVHVGVITTWCDMASLGWGASRWRCIGVGYV